MDLDHCLDLAKKGALEAGACILSYYSTSYKISHKNKDPENLLTQADIESNQILENRLRKAFPAGWLSEESQDHPDRLAQDWVWIIDPLDGTREFVLKIPEFGVSIGLVYRGVPQLGVFYNPVTQQLYWGRKGTGVYCNESPVERIKTSTSLADSSWLVSRSETQKGKFQNFSEFHLQPVGSIANKLTLVASGKAHLTLTLNPRYEWDICAGGFFILETGGRFTDLSQNSILFNQNPPLVAGIVATSPELYPSLMACLKTKNALPDSID
ncbi:MAG: 3'(2'),5'-bisphosphate nucleotidase CysQ [Planctomycetota bacterium]